MKNKILCSLTALVIFIIVLSVASCSDYLNVQDDFSASDSKAFVLTQNPAQVRRFQRYIYKAMPNYSVYSRSAPGGLDNPWEALSDNMTTNLNGPLKDMPLTGYTSSNGNFHRWKELYKVIRQATIFIDSVRPIGRLVEAYFLNEDEIELLKGEAYFFRAYSHYLLFELYGPVPVVLTEADPADPDADYERNSVDEVVDAIEKDLDLALERLEENRQSTNYPSGFQEDRLAIPSKGVALALRAKLRTLVASPLYNGGYEEALGLENKDGKKLFPLYDPKKWIKARESLEALFEYAGKGNYELYRSTSDDPHLNVYELFQRYNKEIIWASPYEDWNHVESAQTPRDIMVTGGNSNWGYMGVTQEMIDAFFMSNGLKINDSGSGYVETGISDVLNPATRFIKGGKIIMLTDKNISNMYANREPRFYAAVTYQGKSWHDVVSNKTLQGNDAATSKATLVYFSKDKKSSTKPLPGYGGIASSNAETGNYPNTGALVYKFNNRTVHPTLPGALRKVYRPSIIFRLGDFYLLYAEVLNEIDPNDPKIVEYLDQIRTRAGIPGYAELQKSGAKTGVIGNQEMMRQAIRDERRVELFGEGQRYFDVRRWMIADKPEGRQGGAFHGMNMEGFESDGSFYKKTEYVNLPRIFERKMYLYPIPYGQIRISNKLVQNPGWEK